MAVDTRVLNTDDILRDFAVDVENARVRHRIRAIAELSQWLSPAQPPEVISKPQTRLLARILLCAVCSPLYLEKKWMKGLYDAIEAAVRSERCPLFSQMGTANLAGERRVCCVTPDYLVHVLYRLVYARIQRNM